MKKIIGFILVAILSVVFYSYYRTHQVLDAWRLLYTGFLITVGLVVILLTVIKPLRNAIFSSLIPKLISIILLFTQIIVLTLGLSVLLQFINCSFDGSVEKSHIVLVINKFLAGGGTSSTPTVEFTSWRDSPPRSLQISFKEYDMVVPKKTHLVIMTKKGALGFEWITSWYFQER